MQIYCRNIHPTGLVHQHSRGFIVLEHYNGCCEIVWKRPISFTIPNITRKSILPPVVSIREERIFCTITFTECPKEKKWLSKVHELVQFNRLWGKKTLISVCRTVLVDVFLSNIPNSYKSSVNNFETAKCLLQVLKNEIPEINTRSLWSSWQIKAFNEVFSLEKRGFLLIAVK